MPYVVDSTLGPSLSCATLSCVLSGSGSKEEGPQAPPQGEQCPLAAPVSARLLSRKRAEAWRAGSVPTRNSAWQREAPTQRRRLHWDTSLCVPSFPPRGAQQRPDHLEEVWPGCSRLTCAVSSRCTRLPPGGPDCTCISTRPRLPPAIGESSGFW